MAREGCSEITCYLGLAIVVSFDAVSYDEYRVICMHMKIGMMIHTYVGGVRFISFHHDWRQTDSVGMFQGFVFLRSYRTEH